MEKRRKMKLSYPYFCCHREEEKSHTEFERRNLEMIGCQREEYDVEDKRKEGKNYQSKGCSSMLLERAISSPKSDSYVIRWEANITN